MFVFCPLLTVIFVAITVFGTSSRFHEKKGKNAIHDELSSYSRRHSLKQLYSDKNFCSRRFVLGRYLCPQSVGNHMHEFLNAFAGAFITDRTLVWDICRRKHCRLDNEEDCALHLTRMPWIPSLADIQSLWSKKKCIGPGPSSMSHLFTTNAYIHGSTKDILMCCCVDQLRERFVEFGALQLREMFSVSVQSSCLGTAARLRANILFQFGEHYGYGALFRSAFVFNPAIIESNNNVIREMTSHSAGKNISISIRSSSISSTEGETTAFPQQAPVAYIGLHLRHSNDEDPFANGTTYGEFDCLRSKIADFLQDSSRRPLANRKCVILLATDREGVVTYWQDNAPSVLGCVVITANHTTGSYVSLPDCHHLCLPPMPRLEQVVSFIEHGPFTGGLAMRDLELLSRSEIFIGSSYTNPPLKKNFYVSSFSLLIAALSATRHWPRVAAATASAAFPPVFIPSCQVAVGAKYRNYTYLTQPYNCTDAEWLMPDMCRQGEGGKGPFFHRHIRREVH